MKVPSTKPVLRDITSFAGAEYNPRKMIPERLEQVRLSLAKLGFVLPIYVNKNNVILSGHQRTTAAKAHGYTKIPVIELDVPDSQEKGLNVIFNKGTNDLDTYATNAKGAFSDYLEKATGLLEGLPDIPPDTYYPCMETTELPIAEALTMAGVDVSTNLREAGYSLINAGIYMPVVMTPTRMLNGKGRVYGYAHKNFDAVEAVVVPEAMGDYAFMALNFLAMDFDIQEHFKDELRFNAFRRKSVQNQIVGLSRTYPYFVYGRVVSNTALKYALLEGKMNQDLMLLPTATEDARKKFQDTYGRTIFDMGAGTLHDSRMMSEAGFDMVPFEPYYCPPESTHVDPDASRSLNSAMLDGLLRVKAKGPDSIISSFVLNSVPHHRDRMAYLTIVSAMCRIGTTVFLGTQSVKTLQSESLSAHLRLNANEPNVTLGNDTRFFKAQKFYYPEELEKMLKFFFASVEVKAVETNLFAKCKFARRPNPQLLREALELEFNLPYKDGSTMGLVDKAKAVFSEYAGMEL